MSMSKSMALVIVAATACAQTVTDPEPVSSFTITTVSTEKPLVDCPNGGALIEQGLDQNGDGALQADEIGRSYSVCNGRDGSNGRDGQDLSASYAAGAGLTLAGDTFAVDGEAIEAIVRAASFDSPEEIRAAVSLFSGAYADLTGAPDLSVYAPRASLASVATTGDYANLVNTPDLGLFARTASLHPVAVSGSWNHLADKPALFSGAYADLTGAPDLSVYTENASLAAVAKSGSWSDLGDKPALFGGSYQDLSDKPALFGGTYAELSGAPDLSVYVRNESVAAVASSGSWNDLADKPALFSGAYADLTGAPDLDEYAVSADLAAVATTGNYDDLSNKPALFSGAYADLSGTPDLAVFATHGEVSWADDASGQYSFAKIAGGMSDARDVLVDPSDLGYAADVWQSFTPTRGGQLMRFSFWFDAYGSGDAAVTLHAGEGTGGPVLFSGSVSEAAGRKDVDLSGANVNVNAGEQYTFRIQRAQDVLLHFGRDYAGGTQNLAPSMFDVAFETTLASGHPVVVTAQGKVGIGTHAPTQALDVDGDTIRVRQPRSPASGSSCEQGEMAWDADFVYVCVAADSWRRSALAAY